MADTRQVVMWCLEYQCALRSPEAETNPGKARTQLSRAAYFSKSRKRKQEGFGIYGDIVVTSHSFARSEDKKISKSYPADGYFFSKEFASVGGPEAMLALCAACPANTTPDLCGGCTGSLMQFPESKETEVQLQDIISRLNLADDYSTHFQRTEPLWYGLWIKSPVELPAVKMLRTIFTQMLAENRNDQGKDPRLDTHLEELTNFIRACEIAEERGFRLHVALTPLGHTDFGFYTIFPHCPVCKAAAQVKRWQRRYPTAPHTCHACGHVFSPAATASSERMDMEKRGLREMLGQAEFEKFAEKYLIAEGLDPNEAPAFVAAAEEAERQRLGRWHALRDAQKEWHETNRRLVREELSQGLAVHAGDSEYTGGEKSPPKFEAADFIEFYRRCKAKGLEFYSVTHESSDGELDRHLFQANTKNVEETVRQWVAEGCTGLYYGSFLYRPKPANQI